MKNFKTKLIIFSVLISSIACNTENNSIIIKKTIKPVNNSSISGTVTFTQENDSVSLEAHVFGLDPGTKAIHIHEIGDCSSEDGLSTGGHWNPYNTKHSKQVTNIDDLVMRRAWEDRRYYEHLGII